jgi:transcription elongation factor GreA
MEEEIVLTEKGLKDLQDRLDFLKTTKREEVAHKIGVARDFGDLSENAEYSAAKDEQTQVEQEISDLEFKIMHAKVVKEEDLDKKIVNVGSFVKLLDEEFNEEIEYHIVGSTESDADNNAISNLSPVGNAVMKKKVGDEVSVITPDGIAKFKILAIRV